MASVLVFPAGLFGALIAMLDRLGAKSAAFARSPVIDRV